MNYHQWWCGGKEPCCCTEQWKAKSDEERELILKGMVRNTDPDTSKIAANGVVKRDKSKLQKRVMEAFYKHGPMTDDELGNLPEFSEYAPTTVRKRRTELYQKGELIMADNTRISLHGNSPMKVWMIPI